MPNIIEGNTADCTYIISEYKQLLRNKIENYYEECYSAFIKDAKLNLNPTSEELEEKLQQIADLLSYLKGDSYSLDQTQFQTSQYYGRLKNSLGNANWKEDITLYTSDNLSEPQEEVYQLLRDIYSTKTDCYFSFIGKKSMNEIVIADSYSYLDYSQQIYNKLIYIDEVQVSVNKHRSFKCDSEDLSSSLKTTLKDLIDDTDYYETQMSKYLSDVHSSIRSEHLQFEEQIKSAVSTYYDELKTRNLGYIESINSYVDEAKTILTNLSETYGDVADVEADLANFNEILSDLNSDFEKVVSSMERLGSQIKGTQSYVNSILSISKKNYLENGEADFSGLSEDSIYAEDNDFMTSAEEKAQIDMLFDAGYIDSSIDRDLVTSENLYQYVNIVDYDDKQLEEFLLMNVTTSSNIEILSNGLKMVQTSTIASGQEINYHTYARINRDIMICESLLVFPNVDKVTDIQISRTGFKVSYSTVNGNKPYIDPASGVVGQSLATSEKRERTWLFGSETNEKVHGTLYGDVKDDELEKLSEREEEIATELYTFYHLDLTVELLAKIPIVGDAVDLLALATMLSYEYNLLSSEAEEAARLIAEKYALMTQRKKIYVYEDCDYFNFTVEYTVTKNGFDDVTASVIMPTEKTIEMMNAIRNANIIAQGPEAPGYEEAMKWSYAQYKSNNGQISYSVFSDVYYEEIQIYNDRLIELSRMSIEEIAGNYEEYSAVIKKISECLHT